MSAPRRGLMRVAAVGCLMFASIAATASPAGATMTVGQVAPSSATFTSCTGAQSTDFLQPTSVVAAVFFVREAGTITSWSTNASIGPGQMYTMKIFRKVGDSPTYRVIGHDGPRTLSPGVNTFPASVGVESGDILGFNESGTTNNCTWVSPGDSVLMRNGSLSDGNSGSFSTLADRRLNISAVLQPSNTFTVNVLSRDRGRGTATLSVNVSNPGFVTVAGKGLSAVGGGKETTQAGPVEIRIKAKGRNQSKLSRTGSVKVKPRVTFGPFNGDTSTQLLKLKLKQKR